MNSNKIKLKQLTYNPIKYEEDGKDHINISIFSKTKLGKQLSIMGSNNFEHKVLGRFDSLESFWSYICSPIKDDRIRYLTGKKLKLFVKDKPIVYPTNFEALIADAIYNSVLQRPSVKKNIIDSSLPFDMYVEKKIENSDKKSRIRVRHHDWLIWTYEEIRKALKENRKPDFTLLMDKPDADLYNVFPLMGSAEIQ